MACYNEWHHLLTGSGKIGFGSNVPNFITGVCIATGQDVASVDSSHSVFSLSVLSSAEIPLIGKHTEIDDLLSLSTLYPVLIARVLV